MSIVPDQGNRADVVQGMVADLHAELERWFRIENPDLSDADVAGACDYMLLHHVLILAVNRDRTGLAAIQDMADRFSEATKAAEALVAETGAGGWADACEGEA